MAKLSIKAGTTSKLLDLFIQDSSKTDGSGLTGLAFNTSGLTAYYYREGAASATAITLATMTLGTWATGGFVVVDGTNMPGCYQLGIPDAALASGAKSVLVMLKGATNMAPVVLEIELTAVDNQSSNSFMTGVNGIAPPTNWNSMSIDGSGRVDIGKILGTASAGAAGYVGLDWGQITNKTTSNSLTGTTISTSQAVASVSGAVASVTGAVGSISGITFPTNFGSLAITVGGAVTVGTNNDKTGYSLSQSFPTNFASLSIDASGRVDLSKVNGSAINNLISGRIDANTQAMATAVIGASQFAAGAVDSSAVATSAVTEIAGGILSNPSNLLATDASGGVNATSINGSATAATRLQRAVIGNVTGTASGTPTTTSIPASLDPAASVQDQFKGRILTFDNATTTTALRGQATAITGNTAGGTLTVTALTTAPSAGDTFTIT